MSNEIRDVLLSSNEKSMECISRVNIVHIISFDETCLTGAQIWNIKVQQFIVFNQILSYFVNNEPKYLTILCPTSNISNSNTFVPSSWHMLWAEISSVRSLFCFHTWKSWFESKHFLSLCVSGLKRSLGLPCRALDARSSLISTLEDLK